MELTHIKDYLEENQEEHSFLNALTDRVMKLKPLKAKNTGDQPLEVALQNNGIEYFFVESHQIEGGVSVGTRRSIGIYGNIEYVPLPPRPATGLSTYEAYWLPEAQVAVMGRNDRAGFRYESAADGYPGDGCYREFHKKDENSGMHYWRITSPSTDLGDKMLYDPVLAMSRINENSDHYTNLLYHMLNDYKVATGLKERSYNGRRIDTELFKDARGLKGLNLLSKQLESFIIILQP
ncbi:MAG: hypothetical protein MZU97_08995 [Bacillus subtilis]|nr:hypothetical protein [Bacillus subtilis]